MREEQDALRHCPTCGGELTDEHDIGLRDYSRWAFDALPGKEGGSDLDFVVEKYGNFFMVETKPNKYVPFGQARMFDALVEGPWTIYIVVDKYWKEDRLSIARWVQGGKLGWYSANIENLKDLLRQWRQDVS